jgi:hypothetical protein
LREAVSLTITAEAAEIAGRPALPFFFGSRWQSCSGAGVLKEGRTASAATNRVERRNDALRFCSLSRRGD